MEPSPSAIGAVTRALHWASAALVAAAFGAALLFNVLGPSNTAGRLVDIHRTIGLTILALTVLRLLWRVFHPLPSLPRRPAWEAWLAKGVQTALYVALLAQPLLGWAASSAQGDSVSYLGLIGLPDLVPMDQARAEAMSTLHKALGFTILALATLHVAGALRHALVKRDGVLRRMVTGRLA